ncbi:tripartite tricarboxylate transporter TctB family protein [Hoeflea marina]|uniref:Tripartite tricarboxylate transporter TctB family protein n=1 Tax=Hoeflea marina TaxID=274592 RepID=A0A317PIA0_9HYPH|nr:tripartite tricarboxylate transporter TctB family protein [Hoeflea marina]PWV97763.1 tripartite tricarboxylate transporter TctB family protein [Hoeflea marina]
MRLPDDVLGMLLLVVAGGYAAMALALPGGAPGDYGPEVFPLLISTLTAAASLSLVFRGLRARRAASMPAVREPRNWLQGAAICAAILAVVFVMPILGFALTICPILFLIFCMLGVRIRVAVLISILATFAIQLIFGTYLLVPLPNGPSFLRWMNF